MVSCMRGRQRDIKQAALSIGAFGAEAAFIELDEVAAKEEAEAGAFFAGGAKRGNGLPAVDFVKDLFGDARACIAYGEFDNFAGRLAFEGDGVAGSAKFN